MTKVRVLENPDGSIRVMHPNWSRKRPDETDEEFLNKGAAKSKYGRLPHMDIEKDELPKDRKDRNDWQLDRNNKTIKIKPKVIL